MDILYPIPSLRSVHMTCHAELNLRCQDGQRMAPVRERTTWRGAPEATWQEMVLTVDAYADEDGKGMFAWMHAEGTPRDLARFEESTSPPMTLDELLDAVGPNPEGARRGALLVGLTVLGAAIPKDHPAVVAFLESGDGQPPSYRREVARFARTLGWPSLAPLVARLTLDQGEPG